KRDGGPAGRAFALNMSPPFAFSSFESCVRYRPDALILLCRCFGEDVAHPDEVVAGQSQQPLEANFLPAAELRLANLADLFTPAHDLLDPLTHLLTDVVAVMPGGAAVDCGAPVRNVLRHVRRDLELAEPGDKITDRK